MDQETVGQVVQGLFGLVGNVASDHVKNMQRQANAERQIQLEHELATKRNNNIKNAIQPSGGGSNQQKKQDPTPENAAKMAQQYNDMIQSLKQGEKCGMCVQLLNEIETLPLQTQAEALPSYNRLKKAVDNGADTQELKNIINKSPVLKKVVDSAFGGPAL